MKITGYRSLRPSTTGAGSPATSTACRAATPLPSPCSSSRRTAGIEGIGLGRARRHRAGLPRGRGRGPAVGRRPVRPDARLGVQGRPLGHARSARSAPSTWRSGTSRRRRRTSRCGARSGARERFVPGYASGLEYGLTDDELAAAVRRVRRPRLQGGKAQGRPGPRSGPPAPGDHARGAQPQLPASRHHVRRRTSRGTTRRRPATSAPSRSAWTSPGWRSRCAAGMPRGWPRCVARSGRRSPAVRT